MLSYSDDNGDSWVSSPLACGGFDGESIGTGPPVSSSPVGYPDLVYYCTGTTPASSPPTTTPICSKSLDGGLTFQPTGAPPWPVADEEAQRDTFGPWAGNPVVGAPVVVEVTGAYPYSILTIQGSHFASSADADAFRRGEFVPAVVPRSITGESELLWEE